MIEFIQSVEQLWACCDPCQRRFYEEAPLNVRHLRIVTNIQPSGVYDE